MATIHITTGLYNSISIQSESMLCYILVLSYEEMEHQKISLTVRSNQNNITHLVSLLLCTSLAPSD